MAEAPEKVTKFVRHISIRSEKLRAMLHEAWIAGNNSFMWTTDAEYDAERKQFVTDCMIRNNLAHEVKK